ncbi:MAG: hypothetical protein H0X24_10815 [Ktedonobacterales bacterium]|nr:hypothetical protein [Ktedonobacterales bacterium]
MPRTLAPYVVHQLSDGESQTQKAQVAAMTAWPDEQLAALAQDWLAVQKRRGHLGLPPHPREVASLAALARGYLIGRWELGLRPASFQRFARLRGAAQAWLLLQWSELPSRYVAGFDVIVPTQEPAYFINVLPQPTDSTIPPLIPLSVLGVRTRAVVVAAYPITFQDDTLIAAGTLGRVESGGAQGCNVKFRGHQPPVLCLNEMVLVPASPLPKGRL